ncbi:hypothetical protein H1215_20630, partial [Anoxybacillus sp. LAT_38]|nr:hypothetical protein [Anoxybacillus sp. LAT_38]
MKKVLFVALSFSVMTASLYGVNATSAQASTQARTQTSVHNQIKLLEDLNLPPETTQKIKKIMESKEAKLLFKGLDEYKQYYTVDENGYSFTK